MLAGLKDPSCMQMQLPVYKRVYSDSSFAVTPFSPAWRWGADEELRLLSSAGATARVYWSAHYHLAHCTSLVPETTFTLCSRGFIAAVMRSDGDFLRVQVSATKLWSRASLKESCVVMLACSECSSS